MSRPLLLGLLLLFVSQPCYAGRYVGESGCVPFHGSGQYWNAIRSYQPTNDLKGRIRRIEENTEGLQAGVCADHDWNIDVAPNADYQSRLANHAGVRNTNGQVELEIKTLPAARRLAQYFPVNTEVHAYGWHVEDCGHDCKAEIHPVIYMRGKRLDNRETVFVGHDVSRRFIPVVTNNTISESFPMALAAPRQAISLAHWTAPVVGLGAVVRERSEADFLSFIFVGDVDWRSRMSEITYTVRHRPVQVDVWATLKPPRTYYDLGVTYGPAEFQNAFPVIPYYLAEFERVEANILSETVDVRVENLGYEDKFIRAFIKTTLTSPIGHTIRYSSWDYDRSGGLGRVREVSSTRTSEQPSHSVEFEIRYEPAPNITANTWHLEVVGSDREPEWNVSRRTSGDTTLGDGSIVTRNFYSASRLYAFTPSRIDLSVGNPVECKVDVSELVKSAQCDCGHFVTRRDTRVHPSINLKANKTRWYVTVVKNGQGDTIQQPTVFELPKASTVGTSHISVSRDANDNVWVEFAPDVGPRGLWNVLGNRAEVLVRVMDETEAQELIAAEIRATAPPCRADLPKAGFRAPILELSKIFLVLQRLQELNLPWTPPAPLPARLVQSWNPNVKGIDAPYKATKRLSKNRLALLQAYTRVAADQSPSDKDRVIASQLIAATRKLPDLNVAHAPEPLTPAEIMYPDSAKK